MHSSREDSCCYLLLHQGHKQHRWHSTATYNTTQHNTQYNTKPHHTTPHRFKHARLTRLSACGNRGASSSSFEARRATWFDRLGLIFPSARAALRHAEANKPTCLPRLGFLGLGAYDDVHKSKRRCCCGCCCSSRPSSHLHLSCDLRSCLVQC